MKTVQSELEAVGLDMLIFNTDVPGGHSEEHGREYLRQIGRKRVDGMIVGDFALHGMHDDLTGLYLPTVFIGHLPNQAVESVKLDDYGGSYLAGEYLARKGPTAVCGRRHGHSLRLCADPVCQRRGRRGHGHPLCQCRLP